MVCLYYSCPVRDTPAGGTLWFQEGFLPAVGQVQVHKQVRRSCSDHTLVFDRVAYRPAALAGGLALMKRISDMLTATGTCRGGALRGGYMRVCDMKVRVKPV